jgi:hypothetical protein
MHGLGEFRYPAGGKYNGELKLGKRCGLGGYLYSRHDTEPFAEFLGQWDDDQPNGWGLRLSKDGSVYLGMLSGGQRHGPGVFVSKKNESKRRGGAGGGGGGTSSNVLTFLRVIIKDGEWAADEYTGATVSLQENVGNFQEDLASGEEQLQELTEEVSPCSANFDADVVDPATHVVVVAMLDVYGPFGTATHEGAQLDSEWVVRWWYGTRNVSSSVPLELDERVDVTTQLAREHPLTRIEDHEE